MNLPPWIAEIKASVEHMQRKLHANPEDWFTIKVETVQSLISIAESREELMGVLSRLSYEADMAEVDVRKDNPGRADILRARVAESIAALAKADGVKL